MTKKPKTATTDRKQKMKRIKEFITPSKKKAVPVEDDDPAAISIQKAMDNLNQSIGEFEQRVSIPIEGFLNEFANLDRKFSGDGHCSPLRIAQNPE